MQEPPLNFPFDFSAYHDTYELVFFPYKDLMIDADSGYYPKSKYRHANIDENNIPFLYGDIQSLDGVLYLLVFRLYSCPRKIGLKYRQHSAG